MNDKNVDELILKLRRKKRLISCGYDLEADKIFIRDRLVHFRKQIVDEKFEIVAPKYLEPLEKNDIEKRFTSEQTPQVVLANTYHNDSVSFSFFIGVRSLSEEIDVLKNELASLFPQNIFYGKGSVSSESGIVNWFDYKSFSLHNEIYQLLFLFDLPSEQRVLGSFQCDFPSYESWHPCILAMIQTIMPLQENVAERL